MSQGIVSEFLGNPLIPKFLWDRPQSGAPQYSINVSHAEWMKARNNGTGNGESEFFDVSLPYEGKNGCGNLMRGYPS